MSLEDYKQFDFPERVREIKKKQAFEYYCVAIGIIKNKFPKGVIDLWLFYCYLEDIPLKDARTKAILLEQKLRGTVRTFRAIAMFRETTLSDLDVCRLIVEALCNVEGTPFYADMFLKAFNEVWSDED